jgi:hypothetical protein
MKAILIALTLALGPAADVSLGVSDAPIQPRLTVSAPGVGLTSAGQALWNLEALLHRTYGEQQLCVSSSLPLRTLWNIQPGICAPLTKYSFYEYVFANARGSRFHLATRRRLSATFGNHASPVLVRGHLVSCDARGVTFLVAFNTMDGGSLNCIPPLPAT